MIYVVESGKNKNIVFAMSINGAFRSFFKKQPYSLGLLTSCRKIWWNDNNDNVVYCHTVAFIEGMGMTVDGKDD